ncbi:MAG: hypothetical protein V3R29_06525 [Candidatus Acidoferrales bacterium]
MGGVIRLLPELDGNLTGQALAVDAPIPRCQLLAQVGLPARGAAPYNGLQES